MRIVERGFPGHFICASDCTFRRNTVIHHNDVHVVVSTVGNMRVDGKHDTVGHNRYYETRAFHAYFDDPYWEADVEKQISFDSDWSISELTFESDYFADRMHENVVEEIANKIEKGEIQ